MTAADTWRGNSTRSGTGWKPVGAFGCAGQDRTSPFVFWKVKSPSLLRPCEWFALSLPC